MLLLDEPLAALDKKLRENTQFELMKIQKQLGMTFIMITHDQGEAMTMSTRIGVIHQGALCQIGSPDEIYEYPDSLRVGDFMGRMNVFDGIVRECSNDYIHIECPDFDQIIIIGYTNDIPINANVCVGIRSEKIWLSLSKPTLTSAHNSYKGVVKEIAYFGDVSLYYIEIKSEKIITVQLTNTVRLAARDVKCGDVVFFCWVPDNGIILDRTPRKAHVQLAGK